MSVQRRKEVVREFLDALADNDREALRAIVRDDIIWWVQPCMEAQGVPRPLQGWDNVPWLSGEGSKAFKPGTTKWIIHQLIAEDEFVVSRHNRQCLTVDDRVYDNEYYFLFRFDDNDMIVEFWESCDTAYAFSVITPTNYSNQIAS